MALKLRRLGIERVRPLAGGIEAWQARQFPLVPWARAELVPADASAGAG